MKTLAFLFLIILTNFSWSQFTWQHVNGPQGGIVTQISANPAGVLFLGSFGGGIYRSSDNGNTWQQKTTGFHSAIFDDGTVIFVLAPNGMIFASSFNRGVLRSTDSGENWTPTSLTNSIIISMVADQNSKIYAATRGGGGVYVTSNFGANWVQKSNGLQQGAGLSSICLSASGELFVAAGSSASVYRSTDNAETWIPTSLTGVTVDHISSVNSTIFAATYGSGIYRTTNSGNNWQQVNSGLTCLKVGRIFCSSSNILAACDSGVFRSTNNGNNWSKIGFDNKRITEVFQTSGGNIIASAYDGIYRSTNNGLNWINSGNGFNNLWITSIAFLNNNIYAGSSYSGLMRSTDNGNSWMNIRNGFKGIRCDLVINTPNGYLFAQSDSGLFRSTNDGNNWALVANTFYNFNAIIYDQNGNLFGCGSYPGFSVWKSTNYGLNWFLPDPLFEASVYCICIAPNGTLFAGTAGGGVYRSTNNGTNWFQTQPSGSVGSLTSSPNGNLFAEIHSMSFGQDGIYLSTDNGVNWQYTGFGDIDYFTLKTNSAGHVFAGGFYGAGVYRSTNNGTNWNEISAGVYNKMIATINFNNAGFLYAGTFYGGIYRTDISTIGIEFISSEIPAKFLLSQNYPNPFNPSTKIRFGIPKRGSVKLTVFDALGKNITELVNSKLNPGTYEVSWNASNHSSGVYFYKLESEGFTQIKKMILVK